MTPGGATRKETFVRVANANNRGVYFAEQLRSWEKEWIRSSTSPEGKQGRNAKVLTLFLDEDVQMSVQRFVAEHGEAITARLLAQAVGELIGGASVAYSIERELDAVEEAQASRKDTICVETARVWLKKLGYRWRGWAKAFTWMGMSART
ncbi:hypothetical protein K470DRAFT_266464 [Piedraia hortae CBS 480.64]|uniref:Uncharacterized protein n=1 Tax=Piedraia hortae CBS 480.64 TaxID=1314780 RepID=A0A6A7BRQ8_9PEZI|nr:hypothetical protein K470DRAFT_266464 [Piedraia hortae CBS 480.64]